MARSGFGVFAARLVPLALALAWLPAAPAASANHDRVNGSIRVEEGERAENLSTVNGSIRVEDKAVIMNAKTVNGSIHVEDGVTAESLTTVNGSVTIGERTRINGNVRSVNGALRLEEETEIGGDVGNVNGRIELDGTRVNGTVRTVSGSIWIGPNSFVGKGIHIEKPSHSGWSWGTREVPKVVIAPGATVEGTLEFEREVKLYVSDTATIGKVVGATPIKFSGDHPPKD